MSSKFVLARMIIFWHDVGMEVSEMARLGGLARAKKLTKAERKASAKKAVEARWSNRKKDKP